jgi:hypothetical protein
MSVGHTKLSGCSDALDGTSGLLEMGHWHCSRARANGVTLADPDETIGRPLHGLRSVRNPYCRNLLVLRRRGRGLCGPGHIDVSI